MQLGPCISELKLPGRLLNHSEAIEQVLGQGTSRLNQGHGSDGPGWGSQGSSARGEGSVTVQSRLRQDDYGSDQGKGAKVAEAGKPRGWRQQSVGGGRSWTQAGLRWVVRARLRQDWNSGHA